MRSCSRCPGRSRRRAPADARAATGCHRRRAAHRCSLQSRRRSQGGAPAADHAEPELRRLRERNPRAAARTTRIRAAAWAAACSRRSITAAALNAQVEIRTLQQKEAVADYARVALRAIGEVENALAASASLATRVALLTEALNEQTRALELTRNPLPHRPRGSPRGRAAAIDRAQRAHGPAQRAHGRARGTSQSAPRAGRQLRALLAVAGRHAMRHSISATREALRRLFFQRCFYLFFTLLALIALGHSSKPSAAACSSEISSICSSCCPQSRRSAARSCRSSS